MTSGIPETPSSYTEEEVEEVVKAWLETLRTPSVTSGFVWEDDNFLNISTTWSVADVTKKERISFVKSYGVLKSSLRWSGDQEVLETKDLIVTSPDAVLITGFVFDCMNLYYIIFLEMENEVIEVLLITQEESVFFK